MLVHTIFVFGIYGVPLCSVGYVWYIYAYTVFGFVRSWIAGGSIRFT
jgi:hypothetical protein